jgi:hypothetical protein
MATYLQGVTDTGFNSVNTTPNLPYMMNALQKVTARYEKNYNELSNEYSKITNSLLLNPENNEFRNKFLDNSKSALKTLSTQDLSIQSNVDQAEQIFSPFWEDKDLMADYVTSNNYQQQVQRHSALRDSDKKEDREQAWDMGLAYVNLTASEMALAKRGDGSIQNIKVRPYVPYKDVSAEISKSLKDMGYGDGIVQSTAGNGYILTVTNGKGTSEIYSNAIRKIIDGRQDLKEIFKVQGVTNFQSDVFERMKEDPSLSKEKAEYLVKENFANKRIGLYETNIKIGDEQINGNKEYKGLIKDIQETEDPVLRDLYEGKITKDSDSYKELIEKKEKLSELLNVKSLYESKITALKSNDYYGTKGEDYFTNMFMESFIDDNAKTREAAVSKKITSDASYRSAVELDAQIKMFDTRMAMAEQKLGIAQQKANAESSTVDGTGGLVTTDANGNIIIESKDKKTGKKEKTKIEELDTPVVGGFYGQAKDLEKSAYYNLQSTKEQSRDGVVSNASIYLNKSSLMTSGIPHIDKYINYLNHYATGGKQTTNNVFIASEIDAAYKALKEKGIITVGRYTDSPNLQLNQLVGHVDANGGAVDDESKLARINYEYGSKLFQEIDNIDKEFNKDYRKKAPNQSLNIHVQKNKNNEYEFITAEKLSKDYPQLNEKNQKFNLPLNLMQQYIDGTLSYEKEPVYAYNTYAGEMRSGRYLVGTNYYITDPSTGKRLHTITKMINKYGTPEEVAAKRKEYESEQNKAYVQFAKSKGGLKNDDWVMSRQLKFRNDPEDKTEDKAAQIAYDAVEEYKGNVIKGSGGIIKPTNYDSLIKGTSEKAVKKLIDNLLSNQNTLSSVLANSYLSYQGETKDFSNVKLEFDDKKLLEFAKNLNPSSKTELSDFAMAATNILINGLTFNVSKNLFKRYAQDNYMTTLVTDKMLSKTLKASDYEKNTLHFDYTISLGSNNQIAVKYKTQKYNVLRKAYEDTEELYETYPKEYGLDNILKEIRSVGIRNINIIEQYFKQQKEKDKQLEDQKAAQQAEANKNNPSNKLPNETFEEFKKRTLKNK